MFDRLAPTYDLLNRAMTLGIDRRWRARAVAMLRDVQGPVLDLCAGTLDLAAMIEDALPNARIVACDVSNEMLLRGRSKVARVETVVGDALALPFEDGTFGAVICGFGVRNLADLRRGLREARRVLRPGGILLFAEHGLAPEAGVQRWQHRLNPLWTRITGGCNLDRPMDVLIRGAGFDLVELEMGYAKGPRPMSYIYAGCGRPVLRPTVNRQ